MFYECLTVENIGPLINKLGPDPGSQVRKEFTYYDKYILVTDKSAIGFIKIWRQKAADPYVNFTIDQCDLVSLKGDAITLEDYILVLDKIFEVPQILRCNERDYATFKNHGFCALTDKLENEIPINRTAAALVPIYIPVTKDSHYIIDESIRAMNDSDVPLVEKLFLEEYTLRHRAVRLLYNMSPSTCLVYDDGNIEGVLLSAVEENNNKIIIHAHQVLVSQRSRRKGISVRLHNALNSLALANHAIEIRGAARGNLVPMYLDRGAKIDPEQPTIFYLIRRDYDKTQKN
ncbi:MAG: hypothetical protein V1837_03730 [Candidatus Woesearchaeota archaeon]